MNTLIKWPGGKSRELKYVESMIPPFSRYIEPFFGGGAMFFHLCPKNAVINDISRDLMDFYALIKEQNMRFRGYLEAYDRVFGAVLSACDARMDRLVALYRDAGAERGGLAGLAGEIAASVPEDDAGMLIWDREGFYRELLAGASDKLARTRKNEEKRPFSPEDLRENLATGFASGTYMYFRGVYNDIHLGEGPAVSAEYAAANFYFVREYCYGSMFRYNARGEFNIPYGGMSYNRKDFGSKIAEMFSPETAGLLRGAQLRREDFEELMDSLELTEDDFMFLDPPYDSDFSDYEGRSFAKADHIRLRDALRGTCAKFILIIRNTDFIYSLYEHGFNVLCYDKTYTYNVRRRNDRRTRHLIVTNLDI